MYGKQGLLCFALFHVRHLSALLRTTRSLVARYRPYQRAYLGTCLVCLFLVLRQAKKTAHAKQTNNPPTHRLHTYSPARGGAPVIMDTLMVLIVSGVGKADGQNQSLPATYFHCLLDVLYVRHVYLVVWSRWKETPR